MEARLFSERPDLLFAYFGISLVDRSRQRETIIRRNIALKRQMMQDLLKPASERRQGEEPFARFNFRKAIIRSIDDSVYPEADIHSGQISGWFGVEIYCFYHNGLEFILNIENGIIDEYGYWDILTEEETYDQSRFKKKKLWYLGRLPYRNIVDYDMLGDEFYRGPHFFCTFSDSGMPWEEFVYAPIDRPYERLKPDMRIK